MGNTTPTRMLHNAQHIKEFYGGFTGTCGETALAVALACAFGTPTDKQGTINLMLAITHQMQAARQASSNGASTLWDLGQEARRRGASVALEWDYQEPLRQDWHKALLDNAGIKPIVLQVGRAYNLKGQDGTGNDEAGVHYHFICVVGLCPDGYIVADGDNWDVEHAFAIYSYQTLINADICGLLMLNMPARPPQQGGNPLDSNYYDKISNTAYKCKQTQQVIANGMLVFYEANDGMYRLGLPLTGELGVKGGTVQVFERGALAYDPKRQYDNPWGATGDVYYAHIDNGAVADWLQAGLKQQVADDSKTIDSLKQQVASASANISNLNKQVATLQAQLASAQQSGGTQVDPAVVNALREAVQVLQPLDGAFASLSAALKKVS